MGGIAGLCFVVLSLFAAAINLRLPTYHQEGAAVAHWLGENGQYGHEWRGPQRSSAHRVALRSTGGFTLMTVPGVAG
jgi:hypothetical protein